MDDDSFVLCHPNSVRHLSRNRGLIENDEWSVCFRIQPMLIKIYSVSRTPPRAIQTLAVSHVVILRSATRMNPMENDQKSSFHGNRLNQTELQGKYERAKYSFSSATISTFVHTDHPPVFVLPFHACVRFIAKFTM